MLNIKLRKMKLVAQVVTQHIEMVKAGLSLPWIKSLFKHFNYGKLQIGDIEILMYTVGFNTSQVNIFLQWMCAQFRARNLIRIPAP